MEVKILKRVKRNLDCVFKKSIKTKEISIDLGNYGKLSVTEHQYGQNLKSPWIDFSIGHTSYGMQMEEFIKLFKSQ